VVAFGKCGPRVSGAGNPVRHHGTGPKAGFTRISNEIVRDARVTSDSFRVYSLLLSHETGYQESVNALATRFGWREPRARKAVSGLEGERLLVRQPLGGNRTVWHVSLDGRFSESEAAMLRAWVGTESSPAVGTESSLEGGYGIVPTKKNNKNKNLECAGRSESLTALYAALDEPNPNMQPLWDHGIVFPDYPIPPGVTDVEQIRASMASAKHAFIRDKIAEHEQLGVSA
jgi:hypothetical protein